MVDLSPAEKFFFDHAGYGYPSGTDPEAGHVAAARELAAAEQRMNAGPYYATVAPDPDAATTASEGYAGPTWLVALWTIGDAADGTDDEWLDAVGGVECDEGSPHLRVITAQLALASLPPWAEYAHDPQCLTKES
jgi:hypothetical protein